MTRPGDSPGGQYRSVAFARAATAAVGLICGLGSCAGSVSPAGRPEASHALATAALGAGYLPGYLSPEERPDSAAWLPPPPASGSAAFEADVEVHRATRALRDSPRWQVAARDARLKFPAATESFACALGLPISEAETPDLYALLRRTLVDAGQATSGAKAKYQRPRPFEVNEDSTCTPGDEKTLRGNGSYPSGHAAAGWAWALILAELAPDRSVTILQRGLDFGASRVICGVHWQSDVDAGRTVAAVAVARLHANDEFAAQLSRAAREVARARAKGTAAPAGCGAAHTD